ncbi:bifunctional riboflavin kinase/FAD synthetase [Corallococcus praedator]|uniref:Riboflavin biosynthesis protein n=1 Tax=Corallococcus praedator TaxID=2316724 RepID=A0ABX9QDV5_9BACT|nr:MULTISPECIES: bifunctional riboflavin kinase/FAD synthetase [Corallococcus]RKH08558.1 bifunctional riboflavin kinase/FAD synthetase [Corallococcus sp. CA047B]RKH33523.1 bifunctional riboflavin kinase/FAD synthetase [Corallococcus sp. CA031C]RKH99235.1 bifunctional riboflavin kinase/FAD synthetase [Corallococcus praedator]
MKVFQSVPEAGRQLQGQAVALGNFDGVHVGHQALFAEGLRHAVASALTFQPHPGKVLQPELAPKLITLLPRKLELLATCGLDSVVVQPFTRDYARNSPADFEAALLDTLGVGHVVVGSDFTYGAHRAGTVTTLREAAAKRGAQVHIVQPVHVDGVVASSSRIREYILEGRVGAARRLLGRPFDLDGTVVAGAGRGRTIGFPTANVDTQNELRPAPGVYAIRVRLHSEADGPWRPGAANIGVKPTFGGTEVTIEAHLLDFTGDLYGKELRVQFLERLRPEQRFGSAAELVGQIKRDVEAARTVVARGDG